MDLWDGLIERLPAHQTKSMFYWWQPDPTFLQLHGRDTAVRNGHQKCCSQKHNMPPYLMVRSHTSIRTAKNSWTTWAFQVFFSSFSTFFGGKKSQVTFQNPVVSSIWRHLGFWRSLFGAKKTKKDVQTGGGANGWRCRGILAPKFCTQENGGKNHGEHVGTSRWDGAEI